MGKAKRPKKHDHAPQTLVSATALALATQTQGTGLTAYHRSALAFLPPPDPPVDDTKTAEEEIAELEADRDQFSERGHPDLAASVQAKIDMLRGTKQKKRRISGDAAALGVTKEEGYYSATSLSYDGQGHLLAGRSRTRADPQSLHAQNRARAKKAAEASWEGYEQWKKSAAIEVNYNGEFILHVDWARDDEGGASSSSPPLGAGMSTARKYAIQYLYVEQFGAAKEDEWDDFHPTSSLPTLIMRLLNIPEGSRASVVVAMRDIYAAHESGDLYDPSAKIKAGRGRKALIEDETPQAEVVYRSMESGLSLGNTVILVNQWRRARSLDPLSYGALQFFVKNSSVMHVEKRGTKKSGKQD